MVLRHLNREAVYSGLPDAKKLSAAGKEAIWQQAIIENGTENWRTNGCVSMRAYTRVYAHTDSCSYILVFIASRLADIERLQDASLTLAFDVADDGINGNLEITC